MDRGTEALTVSHLSNHLLQLKINIIDNRNIIGKHLSCRGLHLNVSGCNQLRKNFLEKIKKFWEGKGCSGTADNNRHEHPSVFDMISAPSSKNSDHQESGDFNFKEYLKDIRQNNLNPANISTSDQRCFNVVDQRWSDVENETKSDVGFSTLHNVDTTSVPDVETTWKQRYTTSKQHCTTLVQHWYNVVWTYRRR